MKPITIIIVEDQGMVLGALAALLNLEDDINIVGQASDGQIALDLINEQAIVPDIVITDIEMPNTTGIELAQQLKQQHPNIKIIILTTFARSGYLKRAMQAGVKGYLLKDAPSDQLSDAVRKVMQGRKIIDPELITDAWGDDDPLTDRERKILRLAADGAKTEEIAKRLHLSAGTVRNYISTTTSKLNARNRIEAIRIAKKQGWL